MPAMRVVLDVFFKDEEGWEDISRMTQIHASDVEAACRQLREQARKWDERVKQIREEQGRPYQGTYAKPQPARVFKVPRRKS